MNGLQRIILHVALSAFALGASQDPDLRSLYFGAPTSDARNAADYTLTIDGIAVPIVKVVTGPQALSAVVLLDLSNSIGPLGVNEIARRISDSVKPGDSIYLGTFADKVLLSRTRVVDNRTASSAAKEVRQPGGVSPLWDALHEATQAIGRASGLRALVVFTDAMATGNEHGFQEVFERLAGAGVIVSVVGVADSALRVQSSVRFGTRSDAVRAIVEMTGGVYSEVTQRSDSPSAHLVAALGELRERCRLDFTPPVRDGALHEIVLTARGNPVPAPRRLRF